MPQERRGQILRLLLGACRTCRASGKIGGLRRGQNTAHPKVKAKLKNILDQTIETERESIVTFEEDPGPAFALSVKWEY